MGDHDALFKHTFGVPEHAAGEIRSMLPPALAAELDLEGLTRVIGSFVDDWQRHLRDVPDAKRLPLIVPVVVHHSEQGWTAPVRFHELFDGLDLHPFLRAIVPDFTLVIDDLIHRTERGAEGTPARSVGQAHALVVARRALDDQRGRILSPGRPRAGKAGRQARG